MKIKEKKVLVFGSGISGEAACSLLLREGAEVVLYDGNDKLDREEILSKIPESGNGSLQILLGTLADEKKAQLLKTLDLVVMSPGVPTDLPIVNEMRDRGIPIWGEIELAYEAGKGDFPSGLGSGCQAPFTFWHIAAHPITAKKKNEDLLFFNLFLPEINHYNMPRKQKQK